MKKKIAVLGADKNLLGFYKQAHDLGYRIIGIAYDQGAVCKSYCDKFYPVSWTNKTEVLRICEHEKIDGITSFSLESALPTLIYVAEKLQLVSNDSDCLLRMQNKYTQRKTFEDAGLSVPFYEIMNDFRGTEFDSIQLPLIIKPVDSGGSIGINKIDSIEELGKAVSIACQNSRSHTAIIEEYIEGREFSVEYISYQGVHYFCQITDKVTSGAPHFIELQHHQPADISSELKDKIKDTVEKALTALKIKNSPSHTEIKLSPNGKLYIIEIGARLGGDKITERLVYLSTGIDMVAESLKLATGDFTPPRKCYEKFAGIYFYCSLTPRVGEFIRKKDDFPWIIEGQIEEDSISDPKSNADRNGYMIYQDNNKKINI